MDVYAAGVMDVYAAGAMTTPLLEMVVSVLLFVVCCFGGAVFLWRKCGKRSAMRSAAIAGFCFLGMLACAVCVSFMIKFSFWVWTAGVLFSIACAVFLFWFLVDPFLPFVEGPALLLVLVSGASLGVCIAVSEAAQSQIFTSSSIVTTLLTALGALYMNKILDERKSIQEMLLPFLSAVVRFRCAITLVSRPRGAGGATQIHYGAETDKGAACFSFEMFTFLRAMESKRLKSQYNTKIFARLHDLCIPVKRKCAAFADYSLQDYGAMVVVESCKTTEAYFKMLTEEPATGTGIATATAGLRTSFADVKEKIDEKEDEYFQDLLDSLDVILETFGFDVMNKSLV